MNLKDAIKRIEQLEARIKQLEALQSQHIHYHYSSPQYIQPIYVPQPYYPAIQPNPLPYEVTC